MENKDQTSPRSRPDDKQRTRRTMYELLHSLVQKVGRDNDWSSLLSLIHQVASVCPQVIVPSRTSHTHIEHSAVPSQEHDFLLWMISSLLRVEALSSSSQRRANITNALLKLFELVKIKDHFVFCYLLKKLIQLLSDLSELCYGVSGKDQSEQLFPVYLSHFQHSWSSKESKSDGSDFEPWLIELQNYYQLNSLLVCSLDILISFCKDVGQFCPDSANTLCHSIGTCMECASLRVKQRTLEMFASLLECMVMASKVELDHLVWCTLAMMDLTHAIREESYLEFESSIVKALKALFISPQGAHLAVLRFWTLLSLKLMTDLDLQIYPMLSGVFQECIGELLLKCNQLAIGESAAKPILAMFGHTCNMQPLVPCLLFRLRQTLSQAAEQQDEMSDDSGPSKKPKLDERKALSHTALMKRHLSMNPQPELVMLLVDKVMTCASDVTSICNLLSTSEREESDIEKFLFCFEGIKAGLDIYVRLAVQGGTGCPPFWWNADQLKQLCNSFELCLYDLTASSFGKAEAQKKLYFNQLLMKILDSIGALGLCMTAGVSIGSVIVDHCVGLIMLLWQQSASPRDSLVAGSGLTQLQWQYLKKSARELASDESRCSSLYALATFPIYTSTTQKVAAFTAAFRSDNPKVVITAVKCFAPLMTSLDKDAIQLIISCFNEISCITEEVKQCLIQELVPVCLASVKINMKRAYKDDNFSLPIHKCCVLTPEDNITDKIAPKVLLTILKLLGEVSDIVLVENLATLSQFVQADELSVIHSKCLALFSSTDPQMQEAVSAHIHLFFPNPDPPLELSQIDELPVIIKLKECFNVKSKEDASFQVFAVSAFGSIARFAGGNLFVSCLYSLLNFVLNHSNIVKATSYNQLKMVAKSRNLTLAKMLSQYKKPICQFLVSIVHEQPSLALCEDRKKNLFYQVAIGFGVKDIKQFFNKHVLELLVPLLVCRATDESSQTLKFIASQTNTISRTLLVESIKHIYLYIVKNGQQQDLNTASKFLKLEANFEMTELLRTDIKSILNLLLLHLISHRRRVLAAVKLLAEMNQSSINYDNDDKIPEYLGPHLHGIIAYFNIVLVRLDYFEDSEKGKQAIGSLVELMKLMGPKYITNVKMKIMAVLRHCLTFSDPEILVLTLSAWNCFINCVDVDSLGPLLGQIVVALSPLVPEHPKTVAEIFEFLIMDNKSILGPYFNEIYLMPDTSELASVNKALKEHSNAPRSFHERIQHVLKGVLHERSDVRSHALKALRKLLKANRAKLEKLTIGSDTVDPIITEIVTTLLRSLHGASAELREDYGICLGELGAIDPGKLEMPIASQTQIVPFYEVDADFAVDLLGELVRAYLAATNIRYQDCCAFAMQEILLIFECGSGDTESEGGKIWSSLSAESQEVLRPHLTSSYSATITKPTRLKQPFFSKNISFHDWIKQWCTSLIHKLPDNHAKKIFLPCSLIFHHDKSLATYLLPYVLITILKLGSAELTRLVHQEIIAVLRHSVQNRDMWQEPTDSSNMCAQTIFTVLDHLSAWAVGKNKAAAIRRLKNQPQRGNPEEISNVSEFLKTIPKETLAQSANRCQAHTRALMYLESYLNDTSSAIEQNLGFLQKIYMSLDDNDGVAGVAAVRKSTSILRELIPEYQSVGNHRNAAACYERIIQQEPDDINHHTGLLYCMMCQGEFTSTLMHVDGLQTKRPEWSQRLNYYRVEASWKLGQWDSLETYLKAESPVSKNWDVNLGRLLLAAKQQDYKSFVARLSKVRGEQMGPLCTASVELGSYQRGYKYIVRLHMLHELESGVEWLLKQDSSRESQSTLIRSWDTRSKLIQESFRTQEPILSLRRVIMGLISKRDKEIGKYWLKSARIARRAGHYQTALSFLLNAKDYSLPEFVVEWALYQKTQSSSYEALLNLQKDVSEQWPEMTINLDGDTQSSTRNPPHVDALLLIGQWMEDTAHVDTQTILKQYKSVISVYPESEDGHFCLGKYYDRLMSVLASDRPAKSSDFLQFIIKHYGNALEYGNKYIYQCMPRMLTLWLDFGSSVPDAAASTSSFKRSQEKDCKNLVIINELMKGIIDRLPPYQFLIAFSQLISRICHPNSDVFTLLEAIVLKLLDRYSQQALWMMIAVSKSTHADRQTKCRRILDRAKRDMPHCISLIDDMEKLCDRLLEVCNKMADPGKNHSMDKLCRGLIRLTTNRFSAIMVPLQSSLNVTLPGDGSTGVHDPFPGVQPTIEKFEDRVEVLGSLQRPKKIIVQASDGKTYILLCKPKDDLRKDARLMEFNSIVNKCLYKDQESRHRRLYIRTYAVVPLNEECGLLEWVSNTHGFRNILLKLYQEKGLICGARELKDIVKNVGRDPTRLKEVFVNQLLPRHPPVFGEWFLRTFPDPTSWYSSRQAYAHTSAVMSVVGYVLGLGDRHGENILFDSTSGDTVHVDFNCLFNRGETFDVPEVVPFRLTHNMEHGLGVTGYEGPFRKSCEAAMKVLRQECDALVCVLKTFIHDPLVEWEKVKGRLTTAEATNEKAVKIVRDIEDRLQGKLYHKTKGLPLSVEGQVHAIIKEATDVQNLSKMYIGWAPFM